jgi:hypothetical protein
MSKARLNNEEKTDDKLWSEEEEAIDQVRKGKSKLKYYENPYELLDELKKTRKKSPKTKTRL